MMSFVVGLLRYISYMALINTTLHMCDASMNKSDYNHDYKQDTLFPEGKTSNTKKKII
jgi:hypothetical protein